MRNVAIQLTIFVVRCFGFALDKMNRMDLDFDTWLCVVYKAMLCML